MRWSGWVLAALALAARASAAQAPHLTGSVEVDLPRGVVEGDLCLSRLPEMNGVRFRLNRGFNIRSVRGGGDSLIAYEGHTELRPAGVALEYSLPESAATPPRLCVSYVGAFPVYAGSHNTFDHKGVIAFNGKTLRAAEEAVWYPVLYDSAAGRAYPGVTYDVRVDCAACPSIYLNGAAPRPGPSLEASSGVPRALLLFAGRFPYREVGGSWFVNSAAPDSSLRAFGAQVGELKRFFEEILSLPYGDALVFLRHERLDRVRPGRTWGFVTWPTIAFAGLDFEVFVASEGGRAALNPALRQFLAHEMGHYYFGTVLQPRGAYEQFFTESTAEYMALKAVQRFAGAEAFRERLGVHFAELAGAPPLVPLDRVSGQDAAGDTYRYHYGPLLLAALEEEIGEARMRRVLHALVASRGAPDYAALRRAARASGVREEVWMRFEERCIRPAAEAACITRFRRPPPP